METSTLVTLAVVVGCLVGLVLCCKKLCAPTGLPPPSNKPLGLAPKPKPAAAGAPAAAVPSAAAAAAAAPAPITAPAAKASEEGIKIDIYYGSQTGTAEGYAKQLALQGRKEGFKARVVGVTKFKAEELAGGGLAMFIMATYGEGDPTDDAVDFTRWLTDAATPASALAGVQYTVFGLGNRQYEHYNKQGAVVDAQVEALGGKRVYPFGMGDDNGNLEDDFSAWKEGLWAALRTAAAAAGGSSGGGAAAAAAAAGGGGSGGRDELPDLPPFEWNLREGPAGATLVPMSPAACAAAAARADVTSRHFFMGHPAVARATRELRQAPSVGLSTRHIEFDLDAALPATTPVYETADNLYVLPHNDAALVAEVARGLGYNLDAVFDLEAAPGEEGGAAEAPSPLFPTPCTVRTLLTQYTDLTGHVRKDLLGHLAHYTSEAAHRARLLHLASSAGRADFNEWVATAQRSVAEVLAAFPSLRIPLHAFVHIMPRLQPRAYTIASSAAVSPRAPAVVVTVKDDVKPGAEAGRRMRGVCSNYMAGLKDGAWFDVYWLHSCSSPRISPHPRLPPPPPPAGDTAMVYVKASTFRLPADIATPILLIGPGTGFAPMRAFLQERAHQRAGGAAPGPVHLYFGCRREAEDFIYKDEMLGWSRDGTLTACNLAFSRDGPRKVYVQDQLRSTGAVVADALMKHGAYVFVCGATAMGKSVKEALVAVLIEHAALSKADAAAAVAGMQSSHRYVEELWG